ncbi:MAG: hypothetical protein AABW51_03860 [Nanoarchaeota archaeon]
MNKAYTNQQLARNYFSIVNNLSFVNSNVSENFDGIRWCGVDIAKAFSKNKSLRDLKDLKVDKFGRLVLEAILSRGFESTAKLIKDGSQYGATRALMAYIETPTLFP